MSNEEDATATVYDVQTGELLAEYETGEEPEGVQATADGRLVFVASEAANLVHAIDLEKDEVIADILVDTRPRRFALSPDGKELWVSAELAGMVNIIDVETLQLVGRHQISADRFQARAGDSRGPDDHCRRQPRLCCARPRQPCGGRRRAAP